MNLRTVGLKIKALRRARGFASQKDFARKIKMSYNHYGKLERGGNTTLLTLDRIATALGTTIEGLLCPPRAANYGPQEAVLHEALQEYILRGEDERRVMEMLLFQMLGDQNRRTGPEGA